MDHISESRLSLVHPMLAVLVRHMAERLAADPVLPTEFRVTQGLRTWEEQARLYEQGRTAPGKIVTNAPPGSSWHNFGLAVDLVPFDRDYVPDWDTQHPTWGRMIEVGQLLGLTSGSAWRTFPDQPHFQLTGVLPMSPDDSVRQAYAEGGLQKVWSLAFPDATLDATVNA